MFKQQKLYVIRIMDNKGRKKNILRLLYDAEEAKNFGYTKILSVAPLFAEDIAVASTAETIMREEEEK